jgi:hypothetical protein
MANRDSGYETTIRAMPDKLATSLFKSRPTLHTRLLNAALPVLWGLVLVVIVGVFFWWF